MEHAFIFQPGRWIGEGKITLSMCDDVIPYKVSWTIYPIEHGAVVFHQTVDIKDLGQKMVNHFSVRNIATGSFDIELTNELVRAVQGKGLIDPKLVAWEFRQKDQNFEGFEVYQLQENGQYLMRGEYAADEGMRTHITGVIHPLDIK